MSGEAPPARLIIADDHPLVREGMRAMLAGEPDLVVVGEAENGLRALELCRSLSPDLVFLDVRMPEMDRLAATQAIKEERPETSVLIVTSHRDPEYLLDAVRAGAAGYVLKEATKQQLLNAVRAVLRGEIPFDQGLAARLLGCLAREDAGEQKKLMCRTLASEPGETPGPRRVPLTPREEEILNLLARGLTNREIAETLTISPDTAKLHVHRIVKKLGVSDRTQAAVRAITLGLTTPRR